MKKFTNIIYLLMFICLTQTAFGGGRTPSCGSDISALEVAFDDSTNNKIHSDGKGVYKTLKGKGDNTLVKFQISDCSYDLVMNLNRSSRKVVVDWVDPYGTMASNSFNFDRVASVPITDWNSDQFKDFCGYGTAPNVVLGENGTYIFDNYGGCGQDPDTLDQNGDTVPGKYFVRRAASFTVEGYEMNFQNPLENSQNPLNMGTSYIKVYHPNETDFVITTDDLPFSASVTAWSVLTYAYNNNPAYIKDHQSMPFSLTVRKLQ